MISSLAGVNPIAGMAAYCASKAALDHFAACLMLEVRQQGVKVTTLAPGSVDTALRRAARGDASWMLSGEDIARTVVDLLSARRGPPEPRRDASRPPPEALRDLLVVTAVGLPSRLVLADFRQASSADVS